MKQKGNLIENLQTVLAPIGQKLGSQRHLSAISSGIMMSAPITLISAFINILANPPVTQDLLDKGGLWLILKPWFNFATANHDAIMVPYNMTIGMFALIAVFGISYRLAQSYKMDAASTSMIALIMFLLTASPMYTGGDGFSLMAASNLGSAGLFGAMVIGLVSVEITRFIKEHNLVIKMPASVPPMVTDSFSAIIPAGINLIIWYSLSLLCQKFAGCLLPELITNILTPLFNVVLNPVTIVLIVTFGNLLWVFGIHGTSVVYSILMPVLMQNMAANADAYLKGGSSALVLYPSSFLLWMAIGGTGSTLALCILMLKSKSAQLKTLGKLALVPNFCGINEPILFGTPIVLNPILAIPFLLVPIIDGVLAYFLLSIGVLDIGHNVLWTMLPLGMQNFLMTQNWVNFVFEYILVALNLFLYYPFFKAYEKQLIMQEVQFESEGENESKEVSM